MTASAPSPTIDPFAPEGARFGPVSPALARVRLWVSGLVLLVPALACAALALWLSPWVWFGAGALVAAFAWLAWLIPRQVRAMGYAEGRSDFLIRRGVMFRRLVVVPYGRIQYVDVAEGPIARHYAIAQIKLHTASASTDADLDGLPAAEAARLRDALASRGTAELAGL